MKYYQLIFRTNFRDNDFYEGRTYIFKSDLELEKGDYVVALTKFGYQIAVVFEKNNVEASEIYAQGIAKIITKLEGNYYLEIEKQKQIKAIEKILNEKAKSISKLMQFETMAKYDSSVKELLEEYKNLKSDSNVLLIESENEIEKIEELPF